MGTFTFRASSRWQSGTYNVGEIGRFIHAGQDESRDEAFRLDGDEPPVLLGRLGSQRGRAAAQHSGSATPSDTSPTRRRGESSSPRWSTSSRATSTCARSSALPDRGRVADAEIRAKGWVSSPNATKEQLVELCQYVQDTSPVRDSLANPVSVTTTRGPLARVRAATPRWPSCRGCAAAGRAHPRSQEILPRPVANGPVRSQVRASAKGASGVAGEPDRQDGPMPASGLQVPA